jgi:hypothetical protein
MSSADQKDDYEFHKLTALLFHEPSPSVELAQNDLKLKLGFCTPTIRDKLKIMALFLMTMLGSNDNYKAPLEMANLIIELKSSTPRPTDSLAVVK